MRWLAGHECRNNIRFAAQAIHLQLSRADVILEHVKQVQWVMTVLCNATQPSIAHSHLCYARVNQTQSWSPMSSGKNCCRLRLDQPRQALPNQLRLRPPFRLPLLAAALLPKQQLLQTRRKMCSSYRCQSLSGPQRPRPARHLASECQALEQLGLRQEAHNNNEAF